MRALSMRKLPRWLVLGTCVLGLSGLPMLSEGAIAQPAALSLEQREDLAHADQLIRQSMILTEEKQFDIAIVLAKEAFAIRGNLLGIEHPDVAGALGTVAGIYYAQGDYEAAAVLYDRTLLITAGTGNTNSVQGANTAQNAAAAYEALSDYEAAARLYAIALSVREDILGPTHPEVALTLEKLAAIHRQQGDSETARSLEARVRAIREAQ